jgi:hypothetical protein
VPDATSRAEPEPFASWDEVVAFALGLPDTELSTSYGKPAVKLRGKAFVYPGREKGSFAAATPMDEKELLIETEPETFWETPHYRGWPAVLIRYGSPSRARIETVIERGWWDRASKAQKAARGGARP